MDKNIETYIAQIVSELTCDEKEKREIIDEMKDHLHLLKDEYLDQGLSDKEATDMALESFGEQKTIKNGFQESISPFYKISKIGTWILFSLYSSIVLFKLLFQRIILRIADYDRLGDPEFNRYFFYPPDSNGFFELEVWKINSSIIPFHSTMNYINGSYHPDLDVILNNTLGNILIFVPLGFFLPILFKNFNKLLKVFVSLIIISFSIEALQFILQIGQFDIDDIILNTIGGVLGYFVIKTIRGITDSIIRKAFQKVIS
ncbi:VanZ family protein [Cytobacillus praedii]|uniref:VanZ family protein n=1 Tax=Cytobacillus praedii TaxID=1742358 RepID=UPI003AF46653